VNKVSWDIHSLLKAIRNGECLWSTLEEENNSCSLHPVLDNILVDSNDKEIVGKTETRGELESHVQGFSDVCYVALG